MTPPTPGHPAHAGRLVLVATPIGNLGDLSPRATEVLRTAQRICCEDTRRTRALLSAMGLPASPTRLVSLHEHNEAGRTGQVLDWCRAGETIAVVTDAGTPAVSDPGQRLVAAAAEAGIEVTTVPGASAILAALVVSGLPTERFCVEGFLPKKGAGRARRLAALAAEARTTVILESPTRLAATLAELAATLGDRPVAVCRELTKLHEEIVRGSLPEVAAAFAEREVRGEVAVVIGGAAPAAAPDDAAVLASVQRQIGGGASPRQAAEAVADELGIPRRRAYAVAIELRDHPG